MIDHGNPQPPQHGSVPEGLPPHTPAIDAGITPADRVRRRDEGFPEPFHHGRPAGKCEDTAAVFIVHATRKLLTRVGKPSPDPGERSTTVLGDWYATVLFWRPQVALFVNEPTLLPVLMPLAPAATVTRRFPRDLSLLLAVHQVSRRFIDAELTQMTDCRIARTSNRSVVGIMTEFSRLAETYRTSDSEPNLIEIAVRLAGTPCGPLYRRHVSPDRELAALIAQAHSMTGGEPAPRARRAYSSSRPDTCSPGATHP